MPLALLALLAASSAQAETTALARLEQTLRAYVAERLELAAEDVEVLHLGVAQLPECADHAKLVLESPPSERFRGHATVMADFYGDEETCISLKLRPRLRSWVRVPVTVEDTAPGEAVTWKVARVELDAVAGEPASPASLVGRSWLARTTLSRGTPLTELTIRPRPDATSGQQVTVLSGSSTLLVKTDGRLVADAFIGERVRVANLFSRAVHDGVLFAPSCVATATVTERMKEACHAP